MPTNLFRNLFQEGLGAAGVGGGFGTLEVILPAFLEFNGSAADNGLYAFLHNPPGSRGNGWTLETRQRAGGMYASFDLITAADGSEGLRVYYNNDADILAGNSLGAIGFFVGGGSPVANRVDAITDGIRFRASRNNNFVQASWTFQDSNGDNRGELILPTNDHNDLFGANGNDVDIIVTFVDDVLAISATLDIYTNAAQDQGVRVTLVNPIGAAGNNWITGARIDSSLNDDEISVTVGAQALNIAIGGGDVTAAQVFAAVNALAPFSAAYFGGEDGSSTPFASLTFDQIGIQNVNFSGGVDAVLSDNSYSYDDTAMLITIELNPRSRTVGGLLQLWRDQTVAGNRFLANRIGGADVDGNALSSTQDGLNGNNADFSGGRDAWVLSDIKSQVDALANYTSEYFGGADGDDLPFIGAENDTLERLGFRDPDTGNSVTVPLAGAAPPEPVAIEVDEASTTIFVDIALNFGLPGISGPDTIGDILDLFETTDVISARLRGGATRATQVIFTTVATFAGGNEFEITLNGYALGPPTNVFGMPSGDRTDAEDARDAYATANPNWVDAYQGNLQLWIGLIYGTSSIFQVLASDGTWRDVQLALKGEKGDPGPKGDAGTGVTEARVLELIAATSLSTLQGMVTDAQIPASIFRDAELTFSAIATLLGLTQTEVNRLIVGVAKSGNNLIFTRNDGTTSQFDDVFTTDSGVADGNLRFGSGVPTTIIQGDVPGETSYLDTDAGTFYLLTTGNVWQLQYTIPASMMITQHATLYFGTSDDDTPVGGELTVAGSMGMGTIAAYAGSKYILIARIASEADITSILFSDDPSSTNAIGAFTKFGSAITPDGETEDYNVWVSNQALTQDTDVIITVL